MELTKTQIKVLMEHFNDRFDSPKTGDDFLNFGEGTDIHGDGYGTATGLYYEKDDIKEIIRETLKQFTED